MFRQVVSKRKLVIIPATKSVERRLLFAVSEADHLCILKVYLKIGALASVYKCFITFIEQCVHQTLHLLTGHA